MKLEDLPCSILRQIVNGDASAIELWKCGNHALNSRLANKGVTEINLKDTAKASTSRWPRCLREFALERLTVDRGHFGPLGSTLTLQAELKKLSPALKSLEIIGHGVSKAFFYGPRSVEGDEGDEDDESNEAPLAKRAKLVEVADAQEHVELWNMDVTWPLMERLVIGGGSSGHLYAEDQSMLHSSFGSSVFGLLPRSLTWFGFPHEFVDGACRDMSTLPSGLQTLHLDTSIGLSGLKTLPKSLTVLDAEVYEVAERLFKRPSILPNLIFPDLAEYDSDLRTYANEGYPWPESIRTLSDACFHSDAHFESLPPKLVSLSAQDGEALVTLRSRYIAGLPRTLETLKPYYIQWQGVNVENWPQNLTCPSAVWLALALIASACYRGRSKSSNSGTLKLVTENGC